MIYLATPYSSIFETVKQHRYERAVRALAVCLSEGVPAISVIVQSHPCAIEGYLSGTSWEDFAEMDKALIRASDELWVVMFDGWRESIGVTAEIKFANEIAMPISFIVPAEMQAHCKKWKETK